MKKTSLLIAACAALGTQAAFADHVNRGPTVNIEFFDAAETGRMSGTIRADSADLNRPVEWHIGEPEGPAPRPGALADFRDRSGCASLSNEDLELCFTIVPDVVQVRLDASTIALKGAEDWIRRETSQEITGLTFVSARHEGAVVEVEFIAQGDSGEFPITVTLARTF